MQLSEDQKKAIEEQKKNCIFCKIVSGEAQAKKVFEDDIVIAIMNINPASKGHLLVMPKEHYFLPTLIPVPIFDHYIKKTKAIAEAAKKAMVNFGCTIFIANGGVAGQQSYHFMAHIIPNDSCPSNFQIPSHKQREKEIARNLDAIRQNLFGIMINYFKASGKNLPKKISELLQDKQKNIEFSHELTVYEDDSIYAVLGDGNEGHVIVRPAKEIKSLDEVDDEVFSEMAFASLYSSMILFQIYNAHGTNIILNDFGKGIEIHVLSRKEDDGLNFFWNLTKLSIKDIESSQAAIKDKCDMIGVIVPKKGPVDMDVKFEELEGKKTKHLRRVP